MINIFTAIIGRISCTGNCISHLPFRITRPGRYYLSKNLASSRSKSITVECSDVEIDGNGHQITYTGSQRKSSIGIYSFSNSHVTVNNLSIKDYAYGLYFNSKRESGEYIASCLPTNITVVNCCLITCKFRGIRLQGTHSNVSNCLLWKTGGSKVKNLFFSMGIELIGEKNSIHNNHIIDTFSRRPNPTIERIYSVYSEGVAISLSEWCPESKLSNNIIVNYSRKFDPLRLDLPQNAAEGISWQRTIGIWLSHTSTQVIIDKNEIANFDWGISICEATKSPMPTNCSIENCEIPLQLGNLPS
jgi:hypothetical protein